MLAVDAIDFPEGEEIKYGDMEEHTYSLFVEGWPHTSVEK